MGAEGDEDWETGEREAAKIKEMRWETLVGMNYELLRQMERFRLYHSLKNEMEGRGMLRYAFKCFAR